MLPSWPSRTGVTRGHPVRRPFVSRRASPGSGTPKRNASLTRGFSTDFWTGWKMRPLTAEPRVSERPVITRCGPFMFGPTEMGHVACSGHPWYDTLGAHRWRSNGGRAHPHLRAATLTSEPTVTLLLGRCSRFGVNLPSVAPGTPPKMLKGTHRPADGPPSELIRIVRFRGDQQHAGSTQAGPTRDGCRSGEPLIG